MKRFLIFLVCTFLICTCFCSGTATALRTDAENSKKWNILVESFDPLPLIEYQVEDVSAISEGYPEPMVSAELERAIEEADPRDAVSYNLKTGEISLIPYEPSEKNDMVETKPSGGLVNG